MQCKAHLCTMSPKHVNDAFASKASYCIWISAILVVGLPVGGFPDCTPLFFWQAAAHVDMSGKVGWEGFDSEGWQSGPHSHLSSGLITLNLCQPKLGDKPGMLHHDSVAIQPSQWMYTDLDGMHQLMQSCWCYDVSNSHQASL